MSQSSKNALLDAQFKNWGSHYPQIAKSLKKDGIVNEKEFNKQKVKILFLAREANNPKQESGDFREWLQEELYGIFAHRLGLLSYGILNNFPDIHSITKENKKEANQKISLINLKKVGGKSISSNACLLSYLKNDFNKNFIMKQISIIEPNIIISGIGTVLLKELFSNEKLSNGNDRIVKFGKIYIIDFYHPSARLSNEAIYNSLFEKYRFIKL